MENVGQLRMQTAEFLEDTLALQSTPKREALIAAASLDHTLESLIDYSGSTSQFIQMLLRTLMKFGAMTDGRNPVEAVLEAAKLFVGPDNRKTSETLIERWHKVGSGRSESPIIDDTDHKRQDYLNALRDRVARLNVSQIAPGQADEVRLESVYIPLPTNLSLTIELRDYKVIDWCVGADQGNAIGATNIELSHLDHNQYDVTAVAKIIKDIQAEIDGEALISSEERRRPLVLAPLWADGRIQDYQRLDTVDVASTVRFLVVLGEPGYGKSTFAQYLTLCLLGSQLSPPVEGLSLERLGRWFHGSLTPIYVDVSEFISWQGFPPLDKEATATHFWDYVCKQMLGLNEDFADQLWEDLIGGRAVIIFDGLDEAPIPVDQKDAQGKRQQQLVSLARSLSLRFRRSRIIFTSRPYEYQALSNSFERIGFKTVSLVPINEAQMLNLAVKLYHEAGLTLEEAEATGSALLKELDSVSDYLKNRPLFLTLMATLFFRNNQSHLPSRKSALLRESIHLLLERGARRRSVGGIFPPQMDRKELDDIYQHLESIAYRAQGQVASDVYGTPDVDIGEILRELVHYNVRMAEMLEYLTHQAGVFDSISPTLFRFSHRTFQEFLAASHLARLDDFTSVREHIQRQPLIWRQPCLFLGDIVAEKDRTSGQLWNLVNSLTDYEILVENEGQDSHWYSIWLAGCIGVEQRLYSKPIEKSKVMICAELISRLRTLLGVPRALSAVDRVRVGRALGFFGDDRHGVGVSGGLPDIEWCTIPAGNFAMGTSETQIEEIRKNSWATDWQFDREVPPCSVTLSEFHIAKYPITQSQFNAFLDAKDGYHNEVWWTTSGKEWLRATSPRLRNKRDDPLNMPCCNVTWYEAVAFCNWFSANLRADIRLPTEAEWEKAARGKDGRLFPWGDEFDSELCNVAETGVGDPSPVGCFDLGSSMPWGSDTPLDMCGNVWEWCTTVCEKKGGEKFSYPYQNDQREDLELGDDYMRVVRGGSYTNVPFLARTSFRGRDVPSFAHRRQGFRVVMIPAHAEEDRT